MLTSASTSQLNNLPFVIGLVIGIGLFFDGFRKIKLRRHMMGLATSKVRSLAMGTVELAGLARMMTPVIDPIFDQPCAYYKIKVQERRGSGKHQHWVTVYERNSNAIPFLLEDSTGKAVILPHGAELHFSFRISLTSSGVGRAFGTPDPITKFLGSVGGAWKSLRLEADILRDKEPFYVLGYAGLNMEQVAGSGRRSIQDIARELKKNPERMKTLDINKDGRVDEKEWEAGLQMAVEDYNKSTPAEPIAAASMPVIRKGPDGVFILADNEKNLLGKYALRGWFQVVAGAALIFIGLYNFGFFH